MRRRNFTIAVAAGAPMSMPARAQNPAADWPNRPVKIVVPFAPGGSTDFMARLMGQKLSEALKQQFVVENRPGAGGNLGMDMVAKSAPDRYTVGLTSIVTHAIAPTLYAKLPYDHIRDFAPVSLRIDAEHSRLPSVGRREFGAGTDRASEENPGRFTFASGGAGASVHQSREMFKWMADVDMSHIPYRGSGPALQDLIAGQTHMMFDNITSCLAHIRGRRLKALATSGLPRSPFTSELPTISDFLPGFQATSLSGLGMPAGTAREIVEKLAGEMRKATETADFRERMAAVATEPRATTPEEFARFIAAETAHWAKVVKASGARVE